jgi:uncharacterized protein Yka (UPF0111/DUF47 family)
MGKNRAEDRAENYVQRARELRTIAQDWLDPEKQETLLWLARDYERMADELTQAEKTAGH